MLDFIIGILAFPVLRDDAARDAFCRDLEQIISWWMNLIPWLTGGPHG